MNLKTKTSLLAAGMLLISLTTGFGQPTSCSASLGANVSFTGFPTDFEPLTYQRQSNGADISGQTNASLVVTNAHRSAAGSFSAVVTNVAGSVTSQPALLLFPAPDGFSEITVRTGGTASLGLIASAAPAFQDHYDLFPIDASENLRDWTSLATLFHTNRSTIPITFLDAAAGTQRRRFYRTPTNHFLTPFPPPDGSYSVEVFSRLVTDPSRTHRVTNDNSSFMVSIWHPAQPAAGGWPSPYADPRIGALGSSYCIPAAKYAGFHGHALVGVPWATNEARYPLVIYSHG